MFSKKATEVTRAVMDMMLRLRADGYHIGHIHSDQGHEFQGHFKRCAEKAQSF
jgi:IS30 family transposase